MFSAQLGPRDGSLPVETNLGTFNRVPTEYEKE